MKLYKKNVQRFTLFLTIAIVTNYLNCIDYYRLIPEVDKNPMYSLTYVKDKNFSLNEDFLRNIPYFFKADTFVETGTYRGYTTENAAKYFAQVHTIELSTELYKIASERLRDYKNILFYNGDSVNVFKNLLPQLKNGMVFWLDGHYSGGETALGTIESPIMQELDLIKENNLDHSIIMIDDIREFYETHSLQGYPSLNMVIEKIYAINKNYQFFTLGDVLICMPKEKNITISPVVKACTISRLYNGKNFKIKDVLEAEKIIAQANGEELNALKILRNIFAAFENKSLQLYRHYYLWMGLIDLEAKRYNNALYNFHQAYERGMVDWRIRIYIAKTKGLLKNNN